MIRQHLAISIFVYAATLGVTGAMAEPIQYTLGFTDDSGVSPTAGSFTYDPATNTFTNFTVTWDGVVWNLTASANSPIITSTAPSCLGGLTGGAASFAMLDRACYPAPPSGGNEWVTGPPPTGQTTQKFNFVSTQSDGIYITLFSSQMPEIPVVIGDGQWSLTSTLSDFQGGTTTAPVFFVGGAPVGEVTGTISGQGAEDYYLFNWGGGAFSASASITGASAGASYLFSGGLPGSCNSLGQALNSGDSFTATISDPSLAPGQYCIGVDANSASDPNFTLTFNTPVGAIATPEPSGFAPLLVALGIVVVRLHARRDRRHS